MVRALARINAFDTMWGAIRSRVENERLRWILARYATYNGSDPRQSPATLNCIAHVELGMGTYGVEGGINALMQGMRRRAEELGVKFVFGQRVDGVSIGTGRRVVGVSKSGETAAARAVLWNADPALLGQKPGVNERSTSGWTWVLRARKSGERPSHAVLFPPNYMQEFKDLFERGVTPTKPTIYLCDQGQSHGIVDGDDVPVFAMINAPAADDAARPIDYVTRRIRASGLVDNSAELVWERGPAELGRRFPGSHGSIYGLSSNSKLSAFKRPPNRDRKRPGLYLASGGAHPGGGMPLCALSGIAAARAALVDLDVAGADDWRVDPR